MFFFSFAYSSLKETTFIEIYIYLCCFPHNNRQSYRSTAEINCFAYLYVYSFGQKT